MRDEKKQNPWKLTPRQCDSLRAICETGSVVAASARLGLTVHTVDGHLDLARRAMGVSTTLLAALEWDRYVRGAETQQRPASVFQWRGFSGNDSVRRAA